MFPRKQKLLSTSINYVEILSFNAYPWRAKNNDKLGIQMAAHNSSLRIRMSCSFKNNQRNLTLEIVRTPEAILNKLNKPSMVFSLIVGQIWCNSGGFFPSGLILET